MACTTFCALRASLSWINLGSWRGTICQDRPNLSFSHLHWLSCPPSSNWFQYLSISSCVSNEKDSLCKALHHFFVSTTTSRNRRSCTLPSSQFKNSCHHALCAAGPARKAALSQHLLSWRGKSSLRSTTYKDEKITTGTQGRLGELKRWLATNHR